ncbi:LysR family transcriptional regulator [Bacterioplanoides sp.]|uniref:LysR family transcriptional regulator n=1 Tax=Bacterioplanoides sp. TaxID=2066072 RepID=UPI003AFFA843
MERLNLNLLRALVVLLEARNVTQAAHQLHLTQSAMSRQLSQLRDYFSDPLLVREQNDYLLSAKAKQLLPKVQAILADVDNLKQETFHPATCQRRFRFACTDYVAQYIFPAVIQRLQREAPGIDLIYEVWKPEQITQLGHLPLDMVSTTLSVLPEGLHSIYLGQDNPVCLMTAQHPLINSEALALPQLADYPFVRLNSGGDKDSFLDKSLEQQGLSRRVLFEVPFFSAAFEVVANSECLMILPEHIAHAVMKQHPLTYRPLSLPVPENHYHLCWHELHDKDPAHAWLRECIGDEMSRSMYSVSNSLASQQLRSE